MTRTSSRHQTNLSSCTSLCQERSLTCTDGYHIYTPFPWHFYHKCGDASRLFRIQAGENAQQPWDVPRRRRRLVPFGKEVTA
jgi:hypothetical protein